MSAVAVIGSAVIHWRTRASLVCTRAAMARSMSRSVRMPIIRPKSLTTTAPVFWLVMRSATSPSVSSGATVMKFGETMSASVPIDRASLQPSPWRLLRITLDNDRDKEVR